MDKDFLVGAATVEITLRLGLYMDGYMARVDVSTHVHDPLTAGALVLEYGNRRAALVTLDVMAVSKGFTDDLRHVIAGLLHTSPDAILICASHTHAAPRGLQDWSPIGEARLDSALVASVQVSIQQAVEQALYKQRPVGMRAVAGGVLGIGGERNHPEHPIDAQVSVLAFEGEKDEPEAVLFHYACHPTVLSAENLAYSADFPGTARQLIQECFPNAICLFINGAAGNISTRFHRRDQSFAEVERLGWLLGGRVVELVRSAPDSTPALGWTCESLALPLRIFPGEARHVEATGDARIDLVRKQGAAIEAQLHRTLHGRQHQQIEICALQIGMWTLLSVPGEAFNDLAQALRNVSSTALVAGYTNDYLGYFPTQSAIDDTTYEAMSSPFDARAHALLQERLANMIGRMQFV